MLSAFASPTGSLSVEHQKPIGYANSKMMGMKKNEAAKIHGQTNLLRPPISMCSVITSVRVEKFEGRRNYRDSSEFNDKIKAFATHGPRASSQTSLCRRQHSWNLHGPRS